MANSEGSRLHNNRWVTEAHPYPLSTTAYAAGDLIGTKMTFPDVIQADYGGGEITNVTVIDKGKQLKALKLLIFEEDLGANTGVGTTWSTGDNATLRVADSDAVECAGVISIGTGDYTSLADNTIASKSASLPFYVKGRNLYGLLVSGGTGSYDSDDIVIKLGIERDN